VVARSEWVVDKSWDVSVPFVVGADGYDSNVRRSLGIAYPEVGPCAWYAVFEFQSGFPDQEEVRVILGDRTTDVLWPLGKGAYRWSFQLPDYVDPEVERLAKYREHFGEPTDRTKDRVYLTAGEINILPDSQLRELIAARAPWFTGAIDAVGWRTVVRFERRLVPEYGRERCWLAGDAAHLGGPVGVQSLNVGMAEARDLAAAIAGVLRKGSSKDALREYSDRYTAEWKRLQGIERTVEPMPNVDPWVWDNRDRLLPCLPGSGSDLTALAGQLGLRVTAGTAARA
jgi:2-polyprenyl-6-methoxyphenol hydroxylase-like FAD-dependent oxidoreductase